MKKELLLILCVLLLAGCATVPIQMESAKRTDVSPLGVFIIASTQGVSDQLGPAARDFVTEATLKSVTDLLVEKNYDSIDINTVLAVDDVFKKTFLSYNIDEKKVAQAAAAKDCKAALIMYFAFTGDQVKLSRDLSLYRNCSAYAWLVNAKTKEITKSSHLPLVQLNDETNGKINPSEAYKSLLGYLATHLLTFDE